MSLLAGLVGAFVPLLPTTPLVLVSAACFMRSSPRLYRWLTTNPLFGKLLRDYRAGRGVPLHGKLVTLALLWGTILASVIFVVSILWVRVLLVAIAVAVSIHIFLIKTYRG